MGEVNSDFVGGFFAPLLGDVLIFPAYPSSAVSTRREESWDDDAQNLHKDWLSVGGYLEGAIKTYEQEKEAV
ncbi:MAG: hypothetical protein ACRC46_04055 [Thermoguttaceae bacterium]